MVMFADVATVILMSFADVISIVMFADVAPFSATSCRSDSQSRRCALMMEQQQDLHAASRNGFLSLGKMDLRAHLSNGFVRRRGAVKNDGSSERRRGGDGFTGPAFDSHFPIASRATRQSMTLAGFTPW